MGKGKNAAERSALMGFVAGALGGMVGAVGTNIVAHAVSQKASLEEGPDSGTPLTQHIAYAGFCGGVYGVLAEYIPGICCAFGTPFGISLAVGAAAVGLPSIHASRLPDKPTPLHYALNIGSHAAFGGATEIIRQVLRRSA